MLIVVFGLTGSGKNFVSDLIAKQYGFYFTEIKNNSNEIAVLQQLTSLFSN